MYDICTHSYAHVCTYNCLSIYIHNYKTMPSCQNFQFRYIVSRYILAYSFFKFVNIILGTKELDFYHLQYIYTFVQCIQSPNHVGSLLCLLPLCCCPCSPNCPPSLATGTVGLLLCMAPNLFHHWTIDPSHWPPCWFLSSGKGREGKGTWKRKWLRMVLVGRTVGKLS